MNGWKDESLGDCENTRVGDSAGVTWRGSSFQKYTSGGGGGGGHWRPEKLGRSDSRVSMLTDKLTLAFRWRTKISLRPVARCFSGFITR